MASPKPKNPALYARVKAEAKRKFKVYPSAYANAWLVRTYKKAWWKILMAYRGGLRKWFAEDWRDVKTGKKCGRSGKKDKGRPYPACRPKRVAGRISKAEARKKLDQNELNGQ